MMPEDRTRGSEPARGRFGRLLAFLDYDGTVTTHECNEIVLQRLVGDAWRPFEDEVKAGRMGHAECFDTQIRLIRAPRAEFLGALVAAAAPAPGLAEFLARPHRRRRAGRRGQRRLPRGHRGVLAARGAAPRRAVRERARQRRPGRRGPRTTSASTRRSATARAAAPLSARRRLLRALRRPGDVVVVFGDGDSDLCPAREADLTFARGWLAERCAAEGLPWRPLDFHDALHALPALAAAEPLAEEPA